MSSRTAFRQLLDELTHPAWEHRFLTAKRLAGETGPAEFAHLTPAQRAETTRTLLHLLEDATSQVRSQAAAALGRLGCREAGERLVTALADPHEWVRVQVGEALARLGTPDLAPMVAHHLETEDDPHVRATLVMTLGQIGDSKMLPVLALRLEDPDSRVRANSVEAIGMLKVPPADRRKALARVAGDANNRVRANLAISLVEAGEARGREILQEMLAAKDEYMRASAAYVLGHLGKAADVPRLVELLADPSWLVRKNAGNSLVKHGARALPRVTAALSSPEAPVRLGALEVIGRLRDASARQAVIALLEDEQGEVRSKAEEVLDRLDGF